MLYRHWYAAVVLMISVALLYACSPVSQPDPVSTPTVFVPAPPPDAAHAPTAAESPKPATAGTGAWLFPDGDRQITFKVTDEGKQPVQVTEDLIRDGNHVVAAYNGKPYATWILSESGVWRQDPKGGGALLRYLPPVLKPDLCWKQVSGDTEVWFHLSRESYADGRGYWRVAVLNQGEYAEFSFEPGRGPDRVESDDRRNPANSFVKQVVTVQAGALGPADRTAYLRQAPPATGAEAAVVEVTPEEFEAALFREPVAAADLNGDGKHEYVYIGDRGGRVTTTDGSGLLEFPLRSVLGRYRVHKHTLPGEQVLIQIMIYGPCYKLGPETTFVWYDTKNAVFRTHPESGVGDCKVYTYKGNGQFEIYQSHNGGPILYTDQSHWEAGQFVTDHRAYNLLLGSITIWNLDKVLNHVAANEVAADELFLAPEVLQAFNEKTAQGAWSFEKLEEKSLDEVLLKASRDGEAAGTLTVQTVPRPTRPGEPPSREAILIQNMTWSD